MKYKIGEISRLLGLSTEGVRYYEENGIVIPKKEMHSETRYYDVWDIHILIRARAYRRLGFSIHEIYKILHSTDSTELPSLLAVKETELEKKIIENINLLKRSREIKKLYAESCNMVYQYRLEISPALFRINIQDGYDLIDSPSTKQLAHDWIDKTPFVFTSGLFPKDQLEKSGKKYKFGFGLGEEYAQYLNVHEDEFVAYHPARLSVFTAMPSYSDVILSPAQLGGAINFMHSNGLVLDGDAISIVINYHKKKGIYNNLHLIWLPVDTQIERK